jgi:hypothetical protein
LGDPGRVLRWDAGDRSVTDLGSPCSACRLGNLAISPDGSRVVVHRELGDVFRLAVREPDGSWREAGSIERDFGSILKIIGWTPDGHIVVDNHEHIDTYDLDGRQITTSGRICCHGNGYGGVLSPDGTLVVGSTLARDFNARDVLIVDVRDGSQRVIAKTPAGQVYAWSPDGRSVLLGTLDPTASKNTVGLRVLSLETPEGPSLDAEVPDEGELSIVWLPALP